MTRHIFAAEEILITYVVMKYRSIIFKLSIVKDLRVWRLKGIRKKKFE